MSVLIWHFLALARTLIALTPTLIALAHLNIIEKMQRLNRDDILIKDEAVGVLGLKETLDCSRKAVDVVIIFQSSNLTYLFQYSIY